MSEAEEELRLLASPDEGTCAPDFTGTVLPAAIKTGFYDENLDALAAAVEARQAELKLAKAAAEIKPGVIVYFTDTAPPWLAGLGGQSALVTCVTDDRVDVAVFAAPDVSVSVPHAMVAPA